VRSRQRLRSDAAWARETDFSILTPLSRAADDTTALETGLERFFGRNGEAKETTRERVKEINELESRLEKNVAFAQRVKAVCCGRWQCMLPRVCEDAKLVLVDTEPALARASRVRIAVERYENILEALSVSRALKEVLPNQALPWRALWQTDERARDAELLIATARRRGEQRGQSLSPIADYVAELERLEKRARLVIQSLEDSAIDNQKSDSFASKKKHAISALAPRRELAFKALHLLQESAALHEERSTTVRLATAQKAADAAQTSAREARKTRIALETANADRRNCMRAIESLTQTLSLLNDNLFIPRDDDLIPRSLQDCRNEEDPVSLEPLTSIPLHRLCKLPSGNCIAQSNLLAMRRDVDPYTNLPLPVNFRQNIQRRTRGSAPAASVSLNRTDINALIASARRACDTAAVSSTFHHQ